MTKAAPTRAGHPGWKGAALVLGLVLIACSQQPPPRPAPTPGEGSGIPALPTLPGKGRALVIEAASSPVLDDLGKRLTLVPYTGTQKVADHDLVIFDGDTHSPQAIAENKLVEEAFRTGKWVLGVDLSAEHKQTGLGGYLHLATQQPAQALMFRKEPTGDGRSVYRILEAKTVGASAAGQGTELIAADAKMQAATFASAALKTLEASTRVTPQQVGGTPVCQDVNTPAAQQVGVQDTPQPIQPFPASLVYAQWCYSDLSLQQYKINGSALNKSFVQTASAIFNTTFTLALNNSQNPLGDYQFLMVQNDTSSTPAVNGFANQSNEEQAWFQDQITHTVSPFSSTGASPFTWVANGPTADNQTTNYTANSGFTVGFSGESPNASYTWSNSTSYNIPDWKVSSSLNGNAVSWNYRSGSPDADNSHTGSSWFYPESISHPDLYGTPIPPNTLSLTQNQFHSAVTYRTSQVDTNWERFLVGQSVTFWNTWCTPVGTLGCTAGGGSGSWGATPLKPTVGDLFKINMAAVVPDPVQSITFSPNPAAPGATVTGTITLQRPAPIDTRVALSTTSTNGNASLQTSAVTVPQGQTSATFTVLTNANGLDANPGSQVVVPITAFNVQNFTAQLTLQNPKVQSVTFNPNPVTAGIPATGTVTMSDPVLSDTTVNLASNSPFVTPSAASVTIPAGQTSATFTVQTSGSGLQAGTTSPATITASLSTQSVSAQLTVTNPTVDSITFSPNPVSGGAPATGTVTLTAPATVDAVLPLTSGSPNVTVPATVTVPKGQTSATFAVQTSSNGLAGGQQQPVTVTSAYAQTAQGLLTVASPKIIGLTYNPTSVRGGQPVTATITLDLPVAADTVITLDGQAATDATVPASVTVPAGQTSATFTIQTTGQYLNPGNARVQAVTATLAGKPFGTTFTVTLPSESFQSFTLNTTQATVGQKVTGTVTLTAPAPRDLQLNIQSSSADVVLDTGNLSVVIPAGGTVAVFVLDTLNVDLDPGESVDVTLTATSPALPNESVQAKLTVMLPQVVTVQSVTFSPNPVTAGGTTIATVTLSGPAPADADPYVAVSSPKYNASAGNLSIKQGQTTATFPIYTISSNLPSGTYPISVSVDYPDGQSFPAQFNLVVP